MTPLLWFILSLVIALLALGLIGLILLFVGAGIAEREDQETNELLHTNKQPGE